NGLSIAAAFGKPTWDRHLLNSKDKLLKIGTSEEIPGFAIMVHPRLSEETSLKIRQAMFKFSETETGKTYFKESGLKGFRLANEKDFKQLDEYLVEIQASKQ
ncbi:MAG: PhnD/SsuA/transferrin family substrate-binding protein, partial [Gammaproteobacteria bacterium]|nr:PhnD/SsuA/transferrin family substrate-binding protein [Gammaproteobacteria bacterium]